MNLFGSKKKSCNTKIKKAMGIPSQLLPQSGTNLHHHHDHLILQNCDITSDHCYLNLPEDIVEDNPLDIENIKEKQDEDNDLQQSAIRHPEWYSRKTFNDITDVLRYTKPGDDPAN